MPRDSDNGESKWPDSSFDLAPTIFHQTWLLEIAGRDSYREAVVSSGGTVVGRLPYIYQTKRRWHPQVLMPALAHVLGPALAPEIARNTSARSLKSVTVTGELIAQLPKASHIAFMLHRGVTDTLAFQVAGFSTGVNFTVEIAPGPPDALWRQLRDKTRNVIRRAQAQLGVTELRDAGQFVDFYQKNLRERGMTNYYEVDVCEKLVNECIRRGAGRIIAAVDPAGALQACVCTIWDHEAEYYYLSSRRPESMNGAISLLIWDAIRHAAVNGRRFDMDGINSNNLLLVTGFGGTISPRYVVWRTAPGFRAAKYVAGQLEAAGAALRGLKFPLPR